MPYKDIERRRAYAREYFRLHRSKMTPEQAEARRIAGKKWDIRNPSSGRKWMLKRKAWFRAFKNSLVCSRCSETHYSCLEFHHRDPKAKLFEIGSGSVGRYSIAEMLNEAAKCDILCANCHRKLHHP